MRLVELADRGEAVGEVLADPGGGSLGRRVRVRLDLLALQGVEVHVGDTVVVDCGLALGLATGPSWIETSEERP